MADTPDIAPSDYTAEALDHVRALPVWERLHWIVSVERRVSYAQVARHLRVTDETLLRWAGRTSDGRSIPNTRHRDALRRWTKDSVIGPLEPAEWIAARQLPRSRRRPPREENRRAKPLPYDLMPDSPDAEARLRALTPSDRLHWIITVERRLSYRDVGQVFGVSSSAVFRWTGRCRRGYAPPSHPFRVALHRWTEGSIAGPIDPSEWMTDDERALYARIDGIMRP